MGPLVHFLSHRLLLLAGVFVSNHILLPFLTHYLSMVLGYAPLSLVRPSRLRAKTPLFLVHLSRLRAKTPLFLVRLSRLRAKTPLFLVHLSRLLAKTNPLMIRDQPRS